MAKLTDYVSDIRVMQRSARIASEMFGDVVDEKEAVKYRQAIEVAAESFSDDIALEYPKLYPSWSSLSVSYETGQRLRYNGILYKVLQDHTSQDGWTPDVSPSLFAKVLIPDANVIPEWEQPDSTNPYMAGDKVTHNGKTWESLIDNNVWEPGATGTESLWKEV